MTSQMKLAAALAAAGFLVFIQAGHAEDPVAAAKAAVERYAGPQTTWQGPTSAPKPAARQDARVPVGRRAERHLARIRPLHEGCGRETRLDADRDRRQGQSGDVARRVQPGHRTQAERDRDLRGRLEPAGSDPDRRRPGHHGHRPACRLAPRASARSASLRQHPGRPARDRQGGGRLGHRRQQRQGQSRGRHAQ